jgi:carbamoyl-phosphate synthase large subunit
MPNHRVIDICVHKYKSYQKFKNAGLTVPENWLINSESDLKTAFKELSNKDGQIWLRSAAIGGGGAGALPTHDFSLAKGWIDKYKGWGNFIAAEMLTPNTVTWLSIWYYGELIVAQTRIRKGWTHGNRSASGVTGVTKVGQTYSDSLVDKIAIKSIMAVSGNNPHGIFGVDMTYDEHNIPNPTEINISRFFTTILFFTKAGLNMPEIFKNLALYGQKPRLRKKINPLPDGLLWLRGMDTSPKLSTEHQIESEIIRLI